MNAGFIYIKVHSILSQLGDQRMTDFEPQNKKQSKKIK